MRTVASWALLLGLVVAPLHGQTTVRISFAFEGEPRPSTTEPGEVGNILARREVLRAWTDSVDVYLDQVALTAGGQGWLRARRGEQTDYRVTVTALPVLAGNTPTAMTAYSLVVFEPVAGDWKYVQNYVGYSLSAQQAAGGIFRGATDAINAKRSGGGRASVPSIGQSAGSVIAIANGQSRIDPAKFLFYRFDLPQGTCTVVGRLEGVAGGALDFEALITDSDGLRNWQTNHSATAYWQSGRVAVATINVALAGPATYYLIVSNVFSGLTWKTVSVQAAAQC
jgi:hypothetical protein